MPIQHQYTSNGNLPHTFLPGITVPHWDSTAETCMLYLAVNFPWMLVNCMRRWTIENVWFVEQSLRRRLSEASFCTFKPPVSTHIATTQVIVKQTFAFASHLGWLFSTVCFQMSLQIYCLRIMLRHSTTHITTTRHLPADVCFCATSGLHPIGKLVAVSSPRCS